MTDADPKNDTYSDTETAARMETALKRALATPPKPHSATKGKRPESSQSKQRFRGSPIGAGAT